jgi:acetyl esterase/lipase
VPDDRTTERADRTLEGPHGPIPVRVYRAGDGPTFVWCHGGGWMGGDLDMPEADAVARAAAHALGGVVVSVDYRLAPDHVFPVPEDDVVAAFEAAAADPSLSADPGRVALGGASAGAHLASLAAARLSGAARPAALLLAYPAADPFDGPYERRPEEIPKERWLGRGATRWLFGGHLGSAYDLTAPDAVVPDDAIPTRVVTNDLPPTLVTTAEVDGLTPQALHYVERLRAVGVDVTHHHVDGTHHGYLNEVGASATADAALARHLGWLRDALASS